VDDYLGALQHYHNAHAHDPHVLEVSRFIIDYPFETRLFPHASQVVRRFKKWGKDCFGRRRGVSSAED